MVRLSQEDEGFSQQLRSSLRKLIHGNEIANALMDFLEGNMEVQELISHGNTLAIGRLNYNDHGQIHSRIASINALTILRILHDQGIKTTIEQEHWGSYSDSQVVVLGATYLHDIGNSIHRDQHHHFAVVLAHPILRDFLTSVYNEEKAHRIRASILECIFSHDEAVACLSLEGGCVTIGDGADMANGRARIPFSLGKIDIHSVSALAIKEVSITEGEKKPVKILVSMTESAGVFQIQNVLGKKINASAIEEYIEVHGIVIGDDEGIIDEVEL